MCIECQLFYLGGFSSGWFRHGIIKGGFFKWCQNVMFKGEFNNWFNKRYIRKINTPFTADFTSSLATNHHGCHIIRIRGRILEISGSFKIRLQDYSVVDLGRQVYRSALQMSFRPNEEGTWTILLNTFKGRWGTDESVEECPFKAGATFEIDIVCESDAFQIYIAGHHLYSYDHRVPIEQVKQLSIVGDVQLDKVGWQKPCDSSSYFCCSARTAAQIERILRFSNPATNIAANIFYILMLLGIISLKRYNSLIILERMGSFAKIPYKLLNNAMTTLFPNLFVKIA